MSIVYNLIVSCDQLLNAICGGDPDITMSGRVGYFSNMDQKAQKKSVYKLYWKYIEKLIDWAYEPVDGPSHCLDAYEADYNELYNKENNKRFFLFFMSLIIIPICIVVGGILRLLGELGFIRFKEGSTLQGIKKICWIFCALIILPAWIVIMALMLIPIFILLDIVLIFLIIMALYLVPVSIVSGGILYLIRKLGFIRSDGRKTLLIKYKITIKEKIRLEKGLKKIFWIIMTLIILPVCIAIMVIILIPVIIALSGIVFMILLITAIYLFSISIVPACILYFLIKSRFIRFNKGKTLQGKYKINVKVKVRLIRGIKKFRNVLKAANKKGINASDTLIIIMDMLDEIFGYFKYSEITSDYNIKKTPYVVTVKIYNKLESLINVYPIKVELKTVPDKPVADYRTNESVDRVIVTNGIDWKVFKINRKNKKNGKQTPEKLSEFNFLKLDPENPDDIDKLFNLSRESLGKSVNNDPGAKAGIK